LRSSTFAGSRCRACLQDQGNAFTGDFTSNRTLETGARNDIKNQAKGMGGNVVYLLTNRAGSTGGFGDNGGSLNQTNVTLSGNVYSCPEERAGQ
jgi:hypothetical protein